MNSLQVTEAIHEYFTSQAYYIVSKKTKFCLDYSLPKGDSNLQLSYQFDNRNFTYYYLLHPYIFSFSFIFPPLINGLVPFARDNVFSFTQIFKIKSFLLILSIVKLDFISKKIRACAAEHA